MQVAKPLGATGEFSNMGTRALTTAAGYKRHGDQTLINRKR